MPQRTVTAKVDFQGEKKSVTGLAHHDHNWGNIGLPLLLNHWYWARTEIGPYTVICSHIVSPHTFDPVESGNFALFKDGKVLTSRTAAAEETHMLCSAPHW